MQIESTSLTKKQNIWYTLCMLGVLIAMQGAYFGLKLRYRYIYSDVLAGVEKTVLYVVLVVIALLVIYLRYALLFYSCARGGKKGSAWAFVVCVLSLILSGGQDLLDTYFDQSSIFATYLKYYIGSTLLNFGISLVIVLFMWVWVSEIRAKSIKKDKPIKLRCVLITTCILQYIVRFAYEMYVLVSTIADDQFESSMVLNAIHKFAYPAFTCACGLGIMYFVIFVIKKIFKNSESSVTKNKNKQ